MFTALLYKQGNLRNYCLAYWGLGLVLLLLQGFLTQDELFLFVNQLTNSWLDYPMDIITFIGSGWIFGTVIGVHFFLKKKKEGLLLLSVYVVSTLIAQGIKHYYPSIPRPQLHFEEIHHGIRLAQGAEVLKLASFPSGHSTSIFALCTTLAYLFQARKITFVFFGIALLVALSRVYVAAHFFRDITAGMFIGVETAALCLLLFNRLLKK